MVHLGGQGRVTAWFQQEISKVRAVEDIASSPFSTLFSIQIENLNSGKNE